MDLLSALRPLECIEQELAGALPRSWQALRATTRRPRGSSPGCRSTSSPTSRTSSSCAAWHARTRPTIASLDLRAAHCWARSDTRQGLPRPAARGAAGGGPAVRRDAEAGQRRRTRAPRAPGPPGRERRCSTGLSSADRRHLDLVRGPLLHRAGILQEAAAGAGATAAVRRMPDDTRSSTTGTATSRRPGPCRDRVELDDETLRDGLQSPSVRRPSREESLAFLRLLPPLGSAWQTWVCQEPGPSRSRDRGLCREIVASRSGSRPNCAARTAPADVRAVLDIAQHVGEPIEITMFVASSPIRCLVEGWRRDLVLRRATECVGFAVEHGAPVTFVAEDSTRTRPDDLKRVLPGRGASRGVPGVCGGHRRPGDADEGALHRALRGGGPAEEPARRRGSTGTATTTAAWPSPTRSPPGGPARLDSTAPPWVSASESATRPSSRSWSTPGCWAGRPPTCAGIMEYAELASRMLGVAIPPSAADDRARRLQDVHRRPRVGHRQGRGDRRPHARGPGVLRQCRRRGSAASRSSRSARCRAPPTCGSGCARHGRACDTELVRRILARAKSANRTLSDDELHALASEGEGSRKH